MAAQTNVDNPRKFVTAHLPWLVAAGAFIIYGITLNGWVSFHSLGTVARISGWMWQPKLDQPLTSIILYPFRLLPEAWIPLALNLFAAACAALVLLLLARSVALLPHDRTHDERLHETHELGLLSKSSAWLPPVLAAVLCGLQLSFWEHATSGTSEMIDLLLFAYIIRCLLEFRVDQKQSWLSRSAFLFAAGMANNWAMIGFLPVYIAALVWLKGLSFFQPRFLVRMACWGLAGSSLYLVLPLLHSASARPTMSFWMALKGNLKIQKDALLQFPRFSAGALALTFLLPLLFIAIRWKSQKTQLGERNKFGLLASKMVFRFVHVFLLGAFTWLALDLPLSPRKVGTGLALLTYYYLGALVAGYCAGYCLLVASGRMKNKSQLSRAVKYLAKLNATGVFIFLGVLPLLLFWRNLGPIRATNGPGVRELATQLYLHLPAGPSVVLSDDNRQLLLLQAELGAHGHDKDAILLNPRLLASGAYQDYMAARFPARWPAPPPGDRFDPTDPIRQRQLLSSFAAREPVVYLHPAFGFCFEFFADQPEGLLRRLTLRPAKSASVPSLDDQSVAANEKYWQDLWASTLATLAKQTRNLPIASFLAADELVDGLQLRPERNFTSAMLGSIYSKALNAWAITLQRLGRWKEAGVWLRRAADLKPDNLSAQINLLYNERWQSGDKSRLNQDKVEDQFRPQFEKYRNWEGALRDNGLVDEPTFLFEAARVLATGGYPRQAVTEFRRCVELAPDWLEPKLWLAQTWVALQDFEQALRVTESVPVIPAQNQTSQAQLMFSRAVSLQGLGRTNEANACIERFVSQQQGQTEVLSTAAQLYLRTMQFGPALAILDRLVVRETNSPELLSNKALAELQLSRPEAAAQTLTKALALAPSNHMVRLNRAIAYLRARQLDAAGQDFQMVLVASPNSAPALSGLGEIAWRKKDTNAALRFYGQYLATGVAKGPEFKLVSERFAQLGGKTKP